MNLRWLSSLCVIFFAFAGTTQAQHLWWDGGADRESKCIYGEVTVLATYPSIYYCGVNWHAGEPAGGYCGIQDNSATQRCTIFSIWDTSPQLHPVVTQADPQTRVRRFGGEGTGGHTDMLLNWKAGETFRFIVTKQPGQTAGTTDARYYIFDRPTGKWRHLATINNPDGGQDSVRTFGASLCSFLENYAGRDKEVPRLATYRLWLGQTANDMKCLTKAQGDGPWGEFNNAYFLSTGDQAKVKAILAGLEPGRGAAVFGEQGKPLPPIPSEPVPEDVVDVISNPPVAPAVASSSPPAK